MYKCLCVKSLVPCYVLENLLIVANKTLQLIHNSCHTLIRLSMVEHPLMVNGIDPSQCSTTGVTKAVVCAILSMVVNIKYPSC